MMKKRNMLQVALCAVLCWGLNSCGQKTDGDKAGAATTQTAKKKKKNNTSDIFFYTSQHRRDKYSPTEEKMGFSNQIGSINNDEFKDNKYIREVWIGPDVKHIANNAFQGCTALETVHFQGVLPVINDAAFMGCTALKKLQADVYTIGLNAFQGCTALESVRAGNHIYWIRTGAFDGCNKLRSVILAITMQKLEDGAFSGCTGVEEFSIPNDFKNRMFGMFPNSDAFRRIYLLSTEYYKMPKNCTPNKQCTLYVPDAFLKQFQDDAEWSQFGKIDKLSNSKYYTAEGFLK